MKKFTHTAGRMALILALGVTASACTETARRAGKIIDVADRALTMKGDSSYSMHLKPFVGAGQWRATVGFRKDSSRYQKGGKAHVKKFIRTVTPMADETVLVAIPGGGNKASQVVAVARAKRVRRTLTRHGVKNVRITFNGTEADAAVLSFYRERRVAVSCPEWRAVTRGRRITSEGWKFGCMTAGAVGASTYARDHSRPARLGKSTGDEAATVADAYRKGDLDPG